MSSPASQPGGGGAGNGSGTTANVEQPKSLLHRNVYVSGLPTGFTSNNFRQLCQQFGKVEASKLCVDPNSSPTKGYGFCLFMDAESASACIKGLHGAVFGGRKLQARYADAAATPQPSTTAVIPNPSAGSGASGTNSSSTNKSRKPYKGNNGIPQSRTTGPQLNSVVSFPPVTGGFFAPADMGPTATVPTAAAAVPVGTFADGAFYSLNGHPLMMPPCATPPLSQAMTSNMKAPNLLSSFTFFPAPGFAAANVSNGALPTAAAPMQGGSFMAPSLSSFSAATTPSQSPANTQQKAVPACSVSSNDDNTPPLQHHGLSNPDAISPLSYSLLSASLPGSSSSSVLPSTQAAAATNNSNNGNGTLGAIGETHHAVSTVLELAPGYTNPNMAALPASNGGKTNPLTLSPPLSDYEAISCAPTCTETKPPSMTPPATLMMMDGLPCAPMQLSFPLAPTPQQQFVFVPMLNHPYSAMATTNANSGNTTAFSQPLFFSPSPFVGMVQQQQ